MRRVCAAYAPCAVLRVTGGGAVRRQLETGGVHLVVSHGVAFEAIWRWGEDDVEVDEVLSSWGEVYCHTYPS